MLGLVSLVLILAAILWLAMQGLRYFLFGLMVLVLSTAGAVLIAAILKP